MLNDQLDYLMFEGLLSVFNIFIYFVCMSVLDACMSVYHACLVYSEAIKDH